MLPIPKQKKGLMFDLWCRTLARTTVAAEAFFTNRSVERLKTTLHLVAEIFTLRSAVIKMSVNLRAGQVSDCAKVKFFLLPIEGWKA